MLTAILTSLEQAKPDLDITVISGNPAATATKHHVQAIHRFAFLKIFQAMAQTDLLLSGGGSLLQDVTSSRSLYYYLSILFLAKLLGKKVMLFAQGIGPIKSSLAKSITRFVCKKADLITVRDDGSLEELKSMGFSDQEVIVTSDAVFSLKPADLAIGREILADYGVGTKPLIGFALRQWEGETRFVRSLLKQQKYCGTNIRHKLFFCHCNFPRTKIYRPGFKV